MARATTLKRIQTWHLSVQDLLLPPRCQLCSEATENLPFQVCDACQRKLAPPDQVQCERCGATRPPEHFEHGCLICQNMDLPFRRTLAIGNYVDTLRESVIEMKRNGNEALVIQLGRWLGRNLAQDQAFADVDYLIPVPSHWIRRFKRGTTVSELLIEGISKLFPRPALLDVLGCNRLTRKQGRLSTRQRFENVRNCFEFNSHKSLEGKNILLVDDVMTSCATAIHAAATVCKEGKASRVDLALVARGVSRG